MDTAGLSNLAMVTAVVLYIMAMTAHAAQWALARGGEPSPREDLAGRIGLAFTMVGFLSQVVAVVTRGIAAHRLPWGNMYEFTTAATTFIALAYLVLVLKWGQRWLALPMTMLLAVANGLAVTVFYVAVAPLMPALHSVWFAIHILAALIAGAAFNVGGIAAILYLLRSRAERRQTVTGAIARLPDSDRIDRLSYRMHAFAFPVWTFTIAAGSVWAYYAWGRFWGWDPKETWSLVTWVIYAGYLHARATRGWTGNRAAWLSIIGYGCIIFNYAVVNVYFPGLHSYAGLPE